ncbi:MULTISPECIES: hypothetical protein [Oceanobacillus]|uniref:Uncharacterized protein n=1 Tax=Oceanobacillus kimchii TaxID=746691 RepID=A0ABQ5TRH7_9BACI|nr:hypothetical protein [Oceanobacillus kimchii]GLO68398.1 hypothetical protein MACH08_41820 [Oceanobacillus kimchii]
MKVQERERKERSDKKRDVKPTIPNQLYECISRISYVTSTPIKDVGEVICKKGLYSTVVTENLSQHFIRDYWANSNVLYAGDNNRERYTLPKGVQKRRITMRFLQKDHDKLVRLSYSLDSTTSAATALLLDASITNTDIVNAYISNHVKKELDSKRLKQLREILAFINKNNPYQENITLGAFISMLVDEVKENAFTMTESIKRWLDKNS